MQNWTGKSKYYLKWTSPFIQKDIYYGGSECVRSVNNQLQNHLKILAEISNEENSIVFAWKLIWAHLKNIFHLPLKCNQFKVSMMLLSSLIPYDEWLSTKDTIRSWWIGRLVNNNTWCTICFVWKFITLLNWMCIKLKTECGLFGFCLATVPTNHIAQ